MPGRRRLDVVAVLLHQGAQRYLARSTRALVTLGRCHG
jgi:hypothetical protein